MEEFPMKKLLILSTLIISCNAKSISGKDKENMILVGAIVVSPSTLPITIALAKNCLPKYPNTATALGIYGGIVTATIISGGIVATINKLQTLDHQSTGKRLDTMEAWLEPIKETIENFGKKIDSLNPAINASFKNGWQAIFGIHK